MARCYEQPPAWFMPLMIVIGGVIGMSEGVLILCVMYNTSPQMIIAAFAQWLGF